MTQWPNNETKAGASGSLGLGVIRNRHSSLPPMTTSCVDRAAHLHSAITHVIVLFRSFGGLEDVHGPTLGLRSPRRSPVEVRIKLLGRTLTPARAAVRTSSGFALPANSAWTSFIGTRASPSMGISAARASSHSSAPRHTKKGHVFDIMGIHCLM